LSVLEDPDGVRSNLGCWKDDLRGGGLMRSGACVLSLAVLENVLFEYAYLSVCGTQSEGQKGMKHTLPMPNSVLLEVSDPLALPRLAVAGGFKSIIRTTSPSSSLEPPFGLFFFFAFIDFGSKRPSMSRTSSSTGSGTRVLSLLCRGVIGLNSSSSWISEVGSGGGGVFEEEPK
jgi:hypothetical protein